jgi:hypothetical protein
MRVAIGAFAVQAIDIRELAPDLVERALDLDRVLKAGQHRW